MTGPSRLVDWQFREGRRLVVSDGGLVVAAILGSLADGVMIASTQRLFWALTDLEKELTQALADIEAGRHPQGAVLSGLKAARDQAVMALAAATEPTEH